jgi:hypothetical protein
MHIGELLYTFRAEPKEPETTDNSERLALIKRLWLELKATPEGTQEYKALIKRVGREAEAFRAALDPGDRGKF